ARAVRDGRQVLTFLKGLITRDVSLSEVGGPITIGRLSGQAARQGLGPLLALTAILSVNLALLNLLPIPILDGGQVVFLIAEAILRRPLSKQHEAELREAAEAVLAGSGKRETGNVQSAKAMGFWAWIRSLFRGSASA